MINLSPGTAHYLASNDLRAGRDIAAHNAFGRNACGWK